MGHMLGLPVPAFMHRQPQIFPSRGSPSLFHHLLQRGHQLVDDRVVPLADAVRHADWAGAGATVPLTGFGYSLAKGVAKAVGEQGLLGVLTGGLTATAGGIAAAVVFSVLMALIFKVLAVSVLYAFSGLLLWRWWTTYISMLTFLHVAVYCLYIVYMLYQMEFFLVSLMTVSSSAL